MVPLLTPEEFAMVRLYQLDGQEKRNFSNDLGVFQAVKQPDLPAPIHPSHLSKRLERM
jgi:hypothetical protein